MENIPSIGGTAILNNNLRNFLERTAKLELKYMYHYGIDDSLFGVETDKYTWCKNVLVGHSSVSQMISYFNTNYAKDEIEFIEKLKELYGEQKIKLNKSIGG